MKYSSDKDFDRFIRDLVRRGYVYKTGKRHGKLFSTDGQYLATVPCTPSDTRALTNFAQELKRKLRIQYHIALNPKLFTQSNIQ